MLGLSPRKKKINVFRRIWLFLIIAGSLTIYGLVPTVSAQNNPRRIIEIRIEGRTVVAPTNTIKMNEGDLVELHWTSDEYVELHLHGYDMKLTVLPGKPGIMAFEAFASGRFPITSHAWGKGGHGHDAIMYFEVYPQ